MDPLTKLGLKYFFTSYGDVYAGFEFEELHLPQYKIIIQSNHLREYNSLKSDERTVESIKQRGWIVPENVIVGSIAAGDFIRPKNYDNGVWFDSHVRKDMFIFGAGASANCIASDDKEDFCKDLFRPPLGNELFARRFRDLYKKYEGVKQSISELQGTNVNVEEFLEDEWKDVERGNETVMSRHINTQYYLQEILMKISNRVCDEYFESNLYSKLARKLQLMHAQNPDRHFGIVSFNQDSILEHFFAHQFKRRITKIDDYIDVNTSPYCIFKPHGSWNWGWKFPKRIDNVIQKLYDGNVNFHRLYYELLGSPQDMLDWNSYGKETFSHDHGIGRFTIDKSKLQLIDPSNLEQYYPALLLPYRDKDELTMPLRHYHCMTAYLRNIENLFIIGWKGSERVFNKVLLTHASSLKKIVIADPNPQIVVANLEKLLLGKQIEIVIYKGGFEEFVENIDSGN